MAELFDVFYVGSGFDHCIPLPEPASCIRYAVSCHTGRKLVPSWEPTDEALEIYRKVEMEFERYKAGDWSLSDVERDQELLNQYRSTGAKTWGSSHPFYLLNFLAAKLWERAGYPEMVEMVWKEVEE